MIAIIKKLKKYNINKKLSMKVIMLKSLDLLSVIFRNIDVTLEPIWGNVNGAKRKNYKNEPYVHPLGIMQID